MIHWGLELFRRHINELDFEIFENLCFLLSKLSNREFFSTVTRLSFHGIFFLFMPEKATTKNSGPVTSISLSSHQP